MTVDKEYCMSAYLMYRSLLTEERCFAAGERPYIVDGTFSRAQIHNSEELRKHLEGEMKKAVADGKAALMLSGGMDSAVLAHWMPKGSQVYTLQCVVPGVQVIDETADAKRHAKRNDLSQKIVQIYWEDFETYAPLLMKHKGAPIHSIEVQIYKAALQAKTDGFERLIFGENADIIYGGMNGLLAKDWTFGEFVERYSYILPYKVLKNPQMILEPFQKYTTDGKVDAHAFINEYFRIEALGTYHNACEAAGIEFVGPFSTSNMAVPIDYQRIRSGDTKYFVREVYHQLYGDETLPVKIPLPRPMNEWMAKWGGPHRSEFYPHCTQNMTGDQKWMVFALENYLNILEKDEKVYG